MELLRKAKKGMESEKKTMIKAKELTTEELLLIANNVTCEYSEKQVGEAKLELYRRRVDDKVIADVMEEKEEAFMRRLDATVRAQQAREDKLNEKNRHVSYHWWEMVLLLFFAPFYLVNSLRNLQGVFFFLPCYLLSRTPVDTDELFPELKRLKTKKYDLKFKQRLLLLITGDMMWIVYGCCQIWL